MEGIVKWFNNERGFGFILADNKQYFVHFSGIEGKGFKTLEEGDKVEFTPHSNERGACAIKVRKIA